MVVRPEGTPCWMDAMFADIEAAKRFYADLLGWTFGEPSAEFGNYTQAYSGGKAVAGLMPQMPDQPMPSAWCLYLASPSAEASAEKVREAGGQLIVEPMAVGDLGSMAVAADPGGVVFGIWQAGTHEGFEKVGEPGAYAWAEVFTREAGKADAFFPTVFPYSVQAMADEHVDYRIFRIGDAPVLGRMEMTPDVDAQVPSYLSVYFAVDDCDAAVAKTKAAGGQLYFGPMDSPFGRFAALSDPQGAPFAVIDMSRAQGEMPKMSDVS